MKKRILSCLIVLCIVCLSACGTENTGYSNNKKAYDMEKIYDTADALMDFNLKLLKQNFEQTNLLLSPASVMDVLGMTANGADGETLKVVEQILGAPLENINEYCSWFRSDQNKDISMADSIWIRKDEKIHVQEAFLENVKKLYDTEIFEEAFSNRTVRKINKWVSKKTDKMIPEILDNLKEDEMICLINAIAFDGEWENPYESYQVKPEKFYSENGGYKEIPFMTSTVSHYFEDADTTGFIKMYKGGKYGFVAFLPKEGMTMQQYLDTLTLEKYSDMMKNITTEFAVYTKIPKFSMTYKKDLKDSLVKMGMELPFNSQADFSKMAETENKNLYISRILHSTKIMVNETGTKAGASTAATMKTESAIEESRELKEVVLNRPFIYVIMDMETKTPIFLGIMMEPEE